MKYLLPLFSLAFLLLQSCGGTSSQTAIEYNDAIIKEQTKIINLTLDLIKYMETDIDKCKEVRVQIVDQCDASLKVIKDLKGFEGSEKLKNAAIDLFTFYKKIYSNEYKQLFDIIDKGAEITQDDLDFIDHMEQDVSAEESKYDKAFADAQNELAKKFNFQIEENENQKKIDAIQ
jgi:hypothetical protein